MNSEDNDKKVTLEGVVVSAEDPEKGSALTIEVDGKPVQCVLSKYAAYQLQYWMVHGVMPPDEPVDEVKN